MFQKKGVSMRVRKKEKRSIINKIMKRNKSDRSTESKGQLTPQREKILNNIINRLEKELRE